MIAHAIRTAKAADLFARIVVSTDDEEIAQIARAEGAEVPFLRPATLADDHATTLAVIQHALNWLDEDQSLPAALCCLYATTPFVQANDLRSGAGLLSEEVDFVLAATEYPFPIQRALKMGANGAIEMFAPEQYATRSQDLEPAFHDAGQFYWGKTNAWRGTSAFFGPRTRAVLLPSHRVQDIDTPADWLRAELMFAALKSLPE